MKLKAKDFNTRRRAIVRPSALSIVEKPVYTYDLTINHTFASPMILITNCYQYTSKHVYMQYYDEHVKKTYATYVPNDFEFELVDPKQAKETTRLYDNILLASLKTNIHHYFTVGADPEIFLQDSKGNLMPAFNFLPAKEKAITGMYGANHKAFWDGFQAEFTTPGGGCLDGHVGHVYGGLLMILDAARKVDPGATFLAKTTVDITPELLANSKEEHVQFGCMPSQNIYSMNGLVANGRQVPFRPAGGHVHLGIGKKTQDEIVQIMKALDAILGVACVSMFASFDDPRRRSMYGLAGEYRLPPHGLEYRTLSNAWTFHPTLTYMVFHLARNAVMFAEQGLLRHWRGSSRETIEVINGCDVKQARVIMERNKDFYLQMFEGSYHGFDTQKADVLFKGFLNGAESVVDKPTDMLNNWNLVKKDFQYNTKRISTNIKLLLEGKKVA